LYKVPLIEDPSDKLIEVHLAALKWNMQQRRFGLTAEGVDKLNVMSAELLDLNTAILILSRILLTAPTTRMCSSQFSDATCVQDTYSICATCRQTWKTRTGRGMMA
jgi:hypothetical protein